MISLILSRFKVSGHSMMPTLKPGQEILVSAVPYLFFSPKTGDIIAFRTEGKFIVKRIKQVTGNRLLVTGDNQPDSKDYGFIERKSIIGKVIYVYA